MARTQQLGKDAENTAAQFLIKQQLRVITRNYLCRGGEIDLIMQEGQYLVFIEVRMRSHSQFGSALASVDWRKQARLIHTAQHYLLKHPWPGPCRFDVIAVSQQGKCEWIKNAFEAG